MKVTLAFVSMFALFGLIYVTSDHHDLNPSKENLWCPHATHSMSKPTVPISGEMRKYNKGMEQIAAQFNNALPIETVKAGALLATRPTLPKPPITLASQHKEGPRFPFPQPTPQQFGRWHTE